MKRSAASEDDVALVAEVWSKHAKAWSQHMGSGSDFFRTRFFGPEFQAFLGDISGKRVVDLCCGEGWCSRLMARMGAKVRGLDIAPGMIEAARTIEAAEPLGIDYAVADAAQMAEIETGSLDLVACFLALMDAPGYERILSEVRRVLRPGGRFCFIVLHPCFMASAPVRVKIRPDELRLAVGKYFKRGRQFHKLRITSDRQTGATQDLDLPRFHKTLSDYVNGLTRTGFALTRIEEPIPSDEAIKASPRLDLWAKDAALCLIVEAAKPH